MIRVCCECKEVLGFTAEHIAGDERKTHGVCDGCMQKLYPDIWKKILIERAAGGVENAQ